MMMKHTKRVVSLALVGILLLALLAGCSAPKLTFGGTSKTAGTVAGRELSTGEYLAYMYTVYTQMGLYQYTQYAIEGYDVWAQEMSYGEGDAAQTVTMDEYVRLATRDAIVTQEAARQLMEKYGIEWDATRLKEAEDSFAQTEGEAWLGFGISRENMVNAYKNTSLNQYSLLKGLYGKGGQREVSESELKKYFDENYLSYKIISVSLTDSEGKELDEDAKATELSRLNSYLAEYNRDQNFEAVVDLYNKASAAEGATVTASKDEDNRVDIDVNSDGVDEALITEIRKLSVGSAAVVEYKSNGSTPTAALILRLDINDPEKKLFETSSDDILAALKATELEEEITEQAKTVVISLKNSVVKACKPQNFDAALA